jgi:hypothetical protein
VYKEKSRASVVLWPSSFRPTKLRETRDISKEARKALSRWNSSIVRACQVMFRAPFQGRAMAEDRD